MGSKWIKAGKAGWGAITGVKPFSKLKEGPKFTEKQLSHMKKYDKRIKKMKDTGTAFQFKSRKSYHAIAPGDATKYKIKKGVAQ